MKSNKVGKSVPERLIFGDKESSKITLLVDGPKSNGQNEAKELFEIFYDPRKKKFRLASGNGGNLVLRAVNNLNVHMDVSVLYRDLKFIV